MRCLPKVFFTQNFVLLPKFFWTQNNFWTKIFLGAKDFSVQAIFWMKYFFKTKICFWSLPLNNILKKTHILVQLDKIEIVCDFTIKSNSQLLSSILWSSYSLVSSFIGKLSSSRIKANSDKSQAYLRLLSGISRTYHMHVLDVYQAYLWNIPNISQAYLISYI